MPRCLVIAPFGKTGSPERQRSDEVYQHIIRPVVSDAGYDPVIRTIDVGAGEPGEIAKRVIKLLRQCELVVADLTDSNPNVLYELALRHVASAPFVLLSENPETRPFYVNGLNVIRVRRDIGGVDATRKELRSQIDAIREERVDFDTFASLEFGPRRPQSRVCKWEISYTKSLARDWLERQDVRVQEAVNRWMEDGQAPNSPGLRNRVVEYLAYNATGGQGMRGELHYIIEHAPTGSFGGYAVCTLAGSNDPQLMKIHGQDRAPRMTILFYQPPRRVDLGPGLSEEIRGFEYSIEFREKSDGTLEGEFNHPEFSSDRPLCIGRSRLFPV